MCSYEKNPAYSFLKPHHENYMQAYLNALRFGIAIGKLGVEDDETTMLMAELIKVVEDLWERRMRESEERFGASLTAPAVEILHAKETEFIRATRRKPS